jgi:hypothetical protein
MSLCKALCDDGHCVDVGIWEGEEFGWRVAFAIIVATVGVR